MRAFSSRRLRTWLLLAIALPLAQALVHNLGYDEWTKKQLAERAREIGIKGRSSMSKQELVSALRSH